MTKNKQSTEAAVRQIPTPSPPPIAGPEASCCGAHRSFGPARNGGIRRSKRGKTLYVHSHSLCRSGRNAATIQVIEVVPFLQGGAYA